MESKTKLLLIVTLMLFGLTIATIINISLNFKKYSINSAINKAELTANIVKDGLTAHMVNGIMDKRNYFLNQISNTNQDIKALWISRSQKVIKQYGKGFANELPRDNVDRDVLKSGKSIKIINGDLYKTTLRVTIPYKAQDNANSLNCLKCHNVKVGDTLGIITMKFDITNIRYQGILTIAKIFGINILFLIIALFLINRFITPYTKMFSDMKKGINKAYHGDFTHIFNTNIKGDAKEITIQLNTLFTKIQSTFGDIKESLATFIPGNITSSDPLGEANIIITELSDIYKFKKTIELDISKDIIYNRIIDVLNIKYNIKHLAFYEVNTKKNKRTLFYINEEKSICFDDVDAHALECRAIRTNANVMSSEFNHICQACQANNLYYLCLPFDITENISLLLSITTETEKELNKAKQSFASIKNYFDAAKPVLESKILMEKLKDTSLRDGMTGLYNRRFLEGVIDKIMSQAKRSKDTYHIFMLDIDFFKMVNDTYGHDVGDKVIVALSKIFKNSIRESDIAIRYGGEEFVIMLHNSTDEISLKIANKINKDFSDLKFSVNDNDIMQKTISIGISKYPTDGDSIWKCIKYADTALYVAKETGRNKIVEFKKEMFEGKEF